MLEGHNFSWLPIIVGVLCILYYFGIIGLLGFRMDFSLVWLVGGGVLIILGLLLGNESGRNLLNRLPKGLIVFAAIVVVILGSIFFVLFSLVCGSAGKEAKKGTYYCIVLGSKANKNNIPTVMRGRLEAAEEYYRANPKVVFVVSGGQGSDEDATEASVMKNYLSSHGVPESQIIEEDKSRDTDENLDFSYELIKKDWEERKHESGAKPEIMICTSGFHVYRALCLAQNKNIENVSGLAADGRAELELNYRIRECVGLLKELLVGNIRLRDMI